MKRCLFCGQLNPDEAAACYCGSNDLEIIEPVEKPAEPVPPSPAKSPTGQIKTYLFPAILLTFLCCNPFGIIAIVYASKVRAKLESGDKTGAIAASKEAQKWCWIAFGLAIIFWIIMMVIGNMMEK